MLRTIVDPIKEKSVRGVKINIGCSNNLEGYRISSYETKEPETLDWIDTFVGAEVVFCDVGANIGLYSLYAAKAKPTSRIISIEPAASNFVRLARNIQVNNVTNILPMNVALAGRACFGYFYLSDLESGSALHTFNATGSNHQKYKQGIIATTLDDLVYVWGVEHPTHLKIDVDGNELDILKGATKVLGNKKLKEILIEVSHEGEKKDPALVYLENMGFTVHIKSKWSVTNADSVYRNYILRRSA